MTSIPASASHSMCRSRHFAPRGQLGENELPTNQRAPNRSCRYVAFSSCPQAGQKYVSRSPNAGVPHSCRPWIGLTLLDPFVQVVNVNAIAPADLASQ